MVWISRFHAHPEFTHAPPLVFRLVFRPYRTRCLRHRPHLHGNRWNVDWISSDCPLLPVSSRTSDFMMFFLMCCVLVGRKSGSISLWGMIIVDHVTADIKIYASIWNIMQGSEWRFSCFKNQFVAYSKQGYEIQNHEIGPKTCIKSQDWLY